MIVIKNRFTGETIREVETLSGADLSKADLSGADLSKADLSGADLSKADLSGADLSKADLSGADLFGADLSGADLFGADLFGANLSKADLSKANLFGANLFGADLFGANLSKADLSKANLFGANLSKANLDKLTSGRISIVPESGSFTGWKKCSGGVLVKMLIPDDAQRSNATGRKCRASHVEVLEVVGADVGVSQHDGKTEYRVGQIVTCDKWGEDRWVECAGGIHFFITRSEAEAY